MVHLFRTIYLQVQVWVSDYYNFIGDVNMINDGIVEVPVTNASSPNTHRRIISIVFQM